MHGMQPAPPMAGVPSQLADVINRMLEKEPSRRYQSAAENREALEAAIDAHRIMTPVPGIPAVSSTGLHPLSTTVGVGVGSATPVPKTPVPRVRSSTEMEKLVTDETMLPQTAAAVTSAVSSRSGEHLGAKQKSRAPLIAALALLVAGGVAAFVVVKNGQSSHEPAQPTSADKPAVTQPAQNQPEVKQPDVKQPDVKQPETQAAGTTQVDVTKAVPNVTNAVPDVAKAVPELTIKKTDPTKSTDKTTKTSKASKTTDKSTKTSKITKAATDATKTTMSDPTTKTTKTTKTPPDKTTTTTTPPKTGAGSGSAAKLPF
jgi:hypothetical protein